ncbi:winged helix-turn-helix domain-containing protein [Streptomyces sp. NPDC045456]|uniref:helix-turn-helix domain-containing protein n=1 Tax=Streptomyces sp. NPDC045456 TaxID=3155254 RepID=UPI0033E5AF52
MAGSCAGAGACPARLGGAQRWTLARVATVIARRFHVRYSTAQTWRILHQRSFSVQVPVRRTAERTGPRSLPGSRRRARGWSRRCGSGTLGYASRTRRVKCCGHRRPGLGPGVASRLWSPCAPLVQDGSPRQG